LRRNLKQIFAPISFAKDWPRVYKTGFTVRTELKYQHFRETVDKNQTFINYFLRHWQEFEQLLPRADHKKVAEPKSRIYTPKIEILGLNGSILGEPLSIGGFFLGGRGGLGG
jgi:hypothetical protein